MLSYAGTFEDEHNIPFVDVRTSDIPKGMIISELLILGSSSTYLRYARVGKLMVKHMELLVFLEKLSAAKKPRFGLAASLLDDFRRNGQPSEVMLELLYTAHNYINNPNKGPVLHATLFYKAGLSTWRQLRKIYDTLDKTALPTFRAFIDTPKKATPTMYQSGQLGFTDTLQLVESGSGGNGKMTTRSRNHEEALVARVWRYFYLPWTARFGVIVGTVRREDRRQWQELQARKMEESQNSSSGFVDKAEHNRPDRRNARSHE